jgi:hypothetical protein
MAFALRQQVLAVVKEQFPDFPCFFGFDFIPQLQAAMAGPFVFVDHAYFGRGYQNQNFRVILSDIHQRKLVERDKPKTFVYEGRDWRTGSDILIFPPSKTIAETFGAERWVEETKTEIRKHTDRRIVVKFKNAPEPLKHYLKTAHAVVGYGTVASVEAALYGVPVFSGPRCPGTPIGLKSLDQIESPSYPDREAWFRSLTHSQFHIDEIRSGLCRETLLDGY